MRKTVPAKKYSALPRRWISTAGIMPLLPVSLLLSCCIILVVDESGGQNDIYYKWRKENMLEIGTKAPAFTLPDQNGQMRSLSDYQGKKVILYFYPKDMTAGCTKQACA